MRWPKQGGSFNAYFHFLSNKILALPFLISCSCSIEFLFLFQHFSYRYKQWLVQCEYCQHQFEHLHSSFAECQSYTGKRKIFSRQLQKWHSNPCPNIFVKHIEKVNPHLLYFAIDKLRTIDYPEVEFWDWDWDSGSSKAKIRFRTMYKISRTPIAPLFEPKI